MYYNLKPKQLIFTNCSDQQLFRFVPVLFGTDFPACQEFAYADFKHGTNRLDQADVRQGSARFP